MGNGRHIGRRALAFARQIRHFDHAATRMTVSIGAAVLVVMATVVPVSTASASSSDVPPQDKTALIMGETGIPTPNDFYVEIVRNQYIAPTHPGQVIEYVAVTTPEELWPFTGLCRLVGLAFGPRASGGLAAQRGRTSRGGNSRGSSTSPFDQSLQAGVADLERAMAGHGNDDLVIYGYSQGSVVANLEKRKLAEQYPAGTKAPDIDFVVGGDPNLPNGGLLAGSRASTSRSSIVVQRPRADRHPVPHRRHHPSVRRRGGFPVVSAQPHLPT